MKKIISATILSFITALMATAQVPQVEMADQMRADGKIYVVVGVMTILFLGMLIYLILLDKKISKIEEQVKESTKS